MNGFETIAIVIGIFFVVGIAVGVLAVVALPPVRFMLWNRRNRRRYIDDGAGNWSKRPPGDDDKRRPPPRWPGI